MTIHHTRIAGEEPADLADAATSIIQDGVAAREALERWMKMQEDDAYVKLDQECESCMYVCKRQWRFHGLRGASGKLYTVGPLCPVLQRFNPQNRYRRLIAQEARARHVLGPAEAPTG